MEPSAGRGNVRSLAGAAAVFLERGRVALSSGPAFGTGGDGHVRLNYATSAAILTEAVERMAGAVGDWRGGLPTVRRSPR